MNLDVVAVALESLRGRLAAVAPHLGVDAAPSEPVGPLLAQLADAVADRPDHDRVWLLATAIAGAYPLVNEVEAVRRGLELAEPWDRSSACLAGVAVSAAAVRSPSITLEIITEGAIVDVDFCARHLHNTGIQRVVRNTVKHWDDSRAHLASWSSDGTGYRRVTPGQRRLVTEWTSRAQPSSDPEPDTLLVPVGARVFLPEVPAHEYIDRLVSLARFSATRVGLIGYDAIPLVSADFVSVEESDRFAHYLTIVKHADVVSSISATTAEEFRGFDAALAAQGLTGPRVLTLPLPTVVPAAAVDKPAARARPLVLMAGSIEPRKNQLGALAAAEILWSQGLDFELFFVGGGGAANVAQLARAIHAASGRGRHVSHGRGISDEKLAAAYRDARCVVFPSLQEGYGLPVAEALASGTPVVTSKFGSTAEIAQAGGCLLVDPRDDREIATALRSLLTDDALHESLVAQARAMTTLSWSDYADALWKQLHSEESNG